MGKVTVQKAIETLTEYGAGFESGYKKGVRDMWEALKDNCDEFYVKTMDKRLCCQLDDKDDLCYFENCPIAEKLLKAVK